MKNLGYFWSENSPLAESLIGTFTGITINALSQRRPIRITLWRPSGDGIQVTSKMHELNDRNEIGTLSFELVRGESGDSVTAEWQAEIREIERVSVIEHDWRASIGVRLIGQKDDRYEILAGVGPYTLALVGFPNPSQLIVDDFAYDSAAYCVTSF